MACGQTHIKQSIIHMKLQQNNRRLPPAGCVQRCIVVLEGRRIEEI